MLNKTLYAALRNVFGKVVIDNEDQAAVIERVPGGQRDWRMSASASHGEQYRVNCPFCGDRRQHLYVSYLSLTRPEADGDVLSRAPLIAHCFRCSSLSDSGNAAMLAQMVEAGLTDLPEQVVSVASAGWAGMTEDEAPAKGAAQLPTLDAIRSFVPAYQPCSAGMPETVEAYLRGRGITDDDMRLRLLGWASIMSRSGRMLNDGDPFVVIPVTMNGTVRGVQARAASAKVPKDRLRYWTHPSMRKSLVVYGLDMARSLGLGVVCEGPFDAIKVGAPGMCLFGHTPSPTQQALLKTVGDCLVWLPDTDVSESLDAVGEAGRFVDEMNAAGVFRLGAHLVRLPGKDAGEMERQAIWEAILAQVPDNVQDWIMDRIVPSL